jgi:ubiquitin-protein ligase
MASNATVAQRYVSHSILIYPRKRFHVPRPAPSQPTRKTTPTLMHHLTPPSLQKELMDLMLHPTPGISAFPSDENMSLWTATIDGPSATPYESLIFKLTFDFPSNYPYAPPVVLFKTPIYHPNVDFSGRICLDILKDKWSAVYNIGTVLLSLQSLLGEPNKYVYVMHKDIEGK